MLTNTAIILINNSNYKLKLEESTPPSVAAMTIENPSMLTVKRVRVIIQNGPREHDQHVPRAARGFRSHQMRS